MPVPKERGITPYTRFKNKWANCTACPLSITRTRVVLCRGHIPCDVLFLGEAPGASEDIIGQPFVGPAGKLLDEIIVEAAAMSLRGSNFRPCFTNVICCLPVEEGSKLREPPGWAIASCEPRLVEFLEICTPRLVVLVGDVASENFKYSDFQNTISITHPAAILRADVVKRPLMYKRCVVTLSNALEVL